MWQLQEVETPEPEEEKWVDPMEEEEEEEGCA
jgi:hypothetical protein